MLEQLMAKKSEIAGSQLTAAVAEIVFEWRNVHSHQGRLIGKKRDKAGRSYFSEKFVVAIHSDRR
jgi:hypothetical protein